MESYQPLYLKYRPQSLSDLVGQTSVAQTLTNAIENDRICHAYLFTGPRGTGKTSSARILAKSLNCESGPTAVPCLKCASCLEIKLGNSPSVFEIDAASNNSVDDARALIERAPLVAQGGRYKLYIIDECHMLTKEAFNALLKTIEEPPPKVVFVLATTEEHKVPPTIISRCQRLMFKLINQQELTAHLRKVSDAESIRIDDEALDLIARRSGGGLRDALGLLDQASLLSAPDKPAGVNDLLILLGAVHEDILLQISEAVGNRDGHTVLTAANTLLLEGREPAVLVLELAKHFLNLTKATYINETGGVSVDSLQPLVLGSPKYLQSLVGQATRFDRSELAQMVEYLDRLEQTCRRSSQPALSLEMGLLALVHRHDITLVRELDKRLRVVEESLNSDLGKPFANQPPHAQKTSSPQSNRESYAGGTPAPPEKKSSTLRSNVEPAYVSASPIRESSPTIESQPVAGTISSSTQNNQVQELDRPQHHQQPVKTIERIEHDDVEPESIQVFEEASIVDQIVSMVSGEPSAVGGLNAEFSALTGVAEASVDRQLVAPPDAVGLTERLEPSSTSSAGGDDIDEFWSQLQDALQNRHIPTYSIVKTHSFPVSLGKDDFVLGVRNETFQKTLDNKIEHLKGACTQVLGRQISVKIKVIADSLPKPSQARSKDHKTESKRDVPADAEEPERALSSGASDQHYPSPPRSVDDNKIRAQVAVAERPTREPTYVRQDGGPESTLIHEAYKIFEGPGSRLIG